MPAVSQCNTQKPSCRTPANDNQLCWELPEYQRNKGHQNQPEVLRLMNGTRLYRLIERGQQQADHGSIDPGQRRLSAHVVAQSLPKRQSTDDQQK